MKSRAVSLEDRYRGALLGLACGDALGATTAFLERDSFAPLTDIVGGGAFEVARGQWTDDTSMAMCLAESLVSCEGFDPVDQMQRYCRWFKEGYWSSKPHCFDLGLTTEYSLTRFLATGNPYAGPTDPDTAGNGSIMRLAPVVLKYFPSMETLLHFAGESSRTTHGATQAVEGCRLLAFGLARLLQGAAKADCLFGAEAAVTDPALSSLARGSFLQKPRSEIDSSGYVVATLEAALWCFAHTDSFRNAVLCAANLGDDADTVAAVTGQLAGAHYGASALPRPWLRCLHRRQDIEILAMALHMEAGAGAA